MHPLVPAIQVEVLIGILCAFVLLYWQVRAYYRHRKDYFATLAVSTLLAIVSTAMAAAPYFVRTPQDMAIKLFWLATPIAILASFLGTWGSVQLFRALER
jgi:hypothetical protein